MEVDKENIRTKVKSKIPLPIEPLPPLPQHVLKKQESEERHPLKTFNYQTINRVNNTGAIKKTRATRKTDKNEKVKAKARTNCPVQTDTRHVTIRQKTEDLDWDYEVFKDDTIRESSIIVISDDDECNENKSGELRHLSDDKKINLLAETGKAVTPVLKSPLPELERIKNIKKSLKRPHSRELQGLSPMVKYEKGDERHKRRLVFNERVQDKFKSPDFFKKSLTTCLNQQYSEDLFAYLLNIETKTASPIISSITRACLINWLMKVNGPNGNPAIVQTACWFFDSVLAIGHVQLEKMQLFAAACYWISQKIHAHAVTAKRLVKCACEAFSTGRLLAAEKAILSKLKFPAQPILPQDYITYLSWCCDDSHPGEVELAATFLCICGLMVDKVLCHEWPSVIGAAAVRNAVLLLRRKDCVDKLMTNPVFKAAEKKTSNISFVCSIQRKAVRLLSSPLYEYKAPLEYFGIPPYFIAQKIISSANELASIDTRIRPERVEHFS